MFFKTFRKNFYSVVIELYEVTKKEEKGGKRKQVIFFRGTVCRARYVEMTSEFSEFRDGSFNLFPEKDLPWVRPFFSSYTVLSFVFITPSKV